MTLKIFNHSCLLKIISNSKILRINYKIHLVKSKVFLKIKNFISLKIIQNPSSNYRA